MISLLLLKQIAQLFFGLALGWVLVKTKLLKTEDSRVLSTVSLYVVGPCMILNTFSIDFKPEILSGMLLALGSALAIHALFLVLTLLLTKPLKLTNVEKGSAFYSNAGNLAIPIISAVLGQEWLVYSSMFVVVQLPILWSHGRMLLTGKSELTFKNIFGNVNLLATLAGIAMMLLRVRLPALVTGALSQVGTMMGPLSMLIIGMVLAGMDFKGIFLKKGVWKATVLRLIVYPLAAVCMVKFSGAAKLVPGGETILLVSLIAAITPAATSIMQLAQIYDQDAEAAGAIYALTVLGCIVTMPLMVWLYQL